MGNSFVVRFYWSFHCPSPAPKLPLHLYRGIWTGGGGWDRPRLLTPPPARSSRWPHCVDRQTKTTGSRAGCFSQTVPPSWPGLPDLLLPVTGSHPCLPLLPPRSWTGAEAKLKAGASWVWVSARLPPLWPGGPSSSLKWRS